MNLPSTQEPIPRGQIVLFAYAMVIVYMLPPILLGFELFRTAAEESSAGLKFFFALASAPGVMTEVHQLLAPVAALMSVYAARENAGASVWGLLVLALAGFLLTLILQVVLTMEDMARDVEGLDFSPNAARDLLQLQRSNFLQYAAVLVGFKLPALKTGGAS